MPVSPTLDIHSVTVGMITQNTLCIPLSTVTNAKTVETQALINCRAGGMLIDQNFTQNFKIHPLIKPITARNVDGTINKKGTIKSYVELEFKINSRKFREWFYVTGLGKQKIILGFTWLQKYNPLINWKTGKIEWKDQKFNFWKWFEQPKLKPKIIMEELPDEEKQRNRTLYLTNEDLNAVLLELIKESIQINKVTIATELAAKENRKKEEKTDKKLVPQEHHEYLDVFSEEKAAQFPESGPWDHKIEMKEGFEPKSTISHWQNNSNWTNSSKKI